MVTGASRGIGRATAQRLAAEGAAVVVNYARSRDEAEAVVATIVAAGGTAVAEPADVRDPAAVAAMIARIEARLGTVDVLVNNAGGIAPHAIAKAGVVLLTKQLAAELSPAGITVNVVCPGAITPRARFRAAPCTRLCAPRASSRRRAPC